MSLKYTLDQVRQRELAHVQTVGRPNPWWPGDNETNDCVGYQTTQLGLRTGQESLGWLVAHPEMISIAAFRAHYQFPEVPPEQIQPGMLVCSNWTGTTVDGHLEAEHMEWAYSRDRGANTITVIGANTGPRPGVPDPNGVWRKVRPLDGHILFAITVPYAQTRPTAMRRHEVAVVAGYVNEEVPGGLPRTTAAGPGPDKGLEGQNYWRLVQTWGRLHGYYGTGYIIDGIPGPRSRMVEAAAFKAATARR